MELFPPRAGSAELGSDEYYRVLTESELRQEWSTPDALYQRLHTEWGFTLDATANRYNAKCERFNSIDRPEAHRWRNNRVFCNPPYQNLEPWVERGYRQALRGGFALLLVPGRLEQRWFHTWARRGLVLIPDRRIQFLKPPDPRVQKTSNPESSMIVVFDPSTLNNHPTAFQMQPFGMREVRRSNGTGRNKEAW